MRPVVRPRLAAGHLVLLGALVLLGVAVLPAALDSSVPSSRLALVRGTGWVAAVLLTLTLLVPAGWSLARVGLQGAAGHGVGGARATPALPAGLVRALGLAALGIAALHATGAVALDLVAAIELLVVEPQLRSGLAALIALVALGATSSPPLRSLLLWRELHLLVYPAALLVLHHTSLSSRTPPWALGALALILGGLCAARLGGGALRLARGATGPSRPGRDGGPLD